MPRPLARTLRAELLEPRDVPAAAFALGTGANANILFRFDTASPTSLQATTPVTGLTPGDLLVGTDFRPATGEFFGVGANAAANTVRVYRIDPSTGAASGVGPPAAVSTIAGATVWGVDFNPILDQIRVVNNLANDGPGGNANNFRLDPTTGALVAIDADLDYTGLPGGNASVPEATIAYTNSGPGPAPSLTTLYGIVAGGDRLVTNGGVGPGFAALTDVGPLGVDTSNNAGMDIFGPANTAVAVLDVGGTSGLYTIDLATGAATLVGSVGDGNLKLIDISVAPVRAALTAGGPADGTARLIPGALGQAELGPTVTAFPGLNVAVRTATADVDGDGTPDIIAVTGPGTPIRLVVISGKDNTTQLVPPFDPFGGNFTGGGFVAAGDFDGDGRAEFVVTPDQGGGPRVSVFSLSNSGLTARANYLGIDDASFRGGARAAVGDVNKDGTPDLVVAAGFGGGPRVTVFDGRTVLGNPVRLIGDFFAFPGTDATSLRNGVFVAAGDVDGDGFADLIFGGGPGGAPRVLILSGKLVSGGDTARAQAAPIANFFVAGNQADRGGVRLATTDYDGDGKADVAAGSGEGSPSRVRVYLGKNFTNSAEPDKFQDLDPFGATLPGGVFVG